MYLLKWRRGRQWFFRAPYGCQITDWTRNINCGCTVARTTGVQKILAGVQRKSKREANLFSRWYRKTIYMLCTDVSRKFDLTNYQLNYIFLGDITENDGKTFWKCFLQFLAVLMSERYGGEIVFWNMYQIVCWYLIQHTETFSPT